MVPNIFTLGIAGRGPLTGKGSGILVMSIVGGTIPPVRVGARANRIGVHHAFLLLTVCYLYGVCHASEAQSQWSHFDAPGSVTENSMQCRKAFEGLFNHPIQHARIRDVCREIDI